jgi:integrase
MKNHFTFSRSALRDMALPETNWMNVYDDAQRGLCLGVSHTGTKSFRVYRKFKGRPVKILLGNFDPSLPETREIPEGTELLGLLGNKASLNVRMARKLATAVNAQLDAGINPTISVRKARHILTLGAIFELYFCNLESEGKKSRQQFRWMFECYLGALPDEPKKKHGRKRQKSKGAVNWSQRQLNSISHEDVQKLRFDLGKNIGHTTSNRVIELLRAIYSFGIKKRLFAGENPAAAAGKFKSESRDRFLQSDELPNFFRALEDEPDLDVRDFFRLALYTGARRGNLLEMRWDQINFESPSWRIPDTKNHEPLTVPLVEEAVGILRNRASRAQSVDWVFPGRGASGHLIDVSRGWSRLLKRAGVTNLRIHDLRRSLGSWMASTGANMVMTQRALGHKTIAASLIYQRMAHNPVRVAMQNATTELTRLANAQKVPVIEISEKLRTASV